MGLFGSRRDRALGRRLRDERAEPSVELLHFLTVEAVPKKKRRLAPALVLVAVLTVLVAGSLGVTGAMASASHSVVTLSKSVYHVVVTPSHTTNDSKGGKGNDGKGGNGNGNGHGDGDDHGHDPFHHQYGHHVPVCHNGHREDVPTDEYFYRLLHGDHSWPCPPPRHT